MRGSKTPSVQPLRLPVSETGVSLAFLAPRRWRLRDRPYPARRGALERFMNLVRVVQLGYPFPQGGRSLARLWHLQAEPPCRIAG